MKISKVNQVENFEKLIVFCNTQSAVYKPSKASIQLTALSALLTQAQQSLRATDGARTAYENAVNSRKPLFAGLPKLAARIVDALVASGASKAVITDAIAIKNRLHGPVRKLVPVTTPGTPNTTTNQYRYGMSHLDLASRIESMEQLINRVVMEPLYKPNENDLKVASLQALVQQLKVANRQVMNAYTSEKNARRLLNGVLYQANGVYENARLVKAYLRSVFGNTSAAYKEVVDLTFTSK
jgi:hypothetical protein